MHGSSLSRDADPSLDALLRDCTVRIDVAGSNGTGFFVAPGRILTCAHVVKDAHERQKDVRILWRKTVQTATILEYLPDEHPDLALLSVGNTDHPCVFLGDGLTLDDRVYTYGYTDIRPAGDSSTFTYEGPSDDNHFIKLKEGQARKGLSGGPVLSLRLRRVCGIIRLTRGNETDLGARAVPTSAIFQYLAGLQQAQIDWHSSHLTWRSHGAMDLPEDALHAVQGYLRRFRRDFLMYRRTRGHFRSYFPITFATQSDEESPLSDLLATVMENQRILIRARAGAGKTIALERLAEMALMNDHVPIFLDLKKWRQELELEIASDLNDKNFTRQLRAILKISITSLDNNALRKFTDATPKIVMLDGLNEVIPEIATRILKVLDEWVRRKADSMSIVIADRVTVRELPEHWSIVQLNALSNEFVQEEVDKVFGVEAFSATSEKTRLILKTPFFLDYALETKTLGLESEAGIIRKFFINQIGLVDADIDRLSETAFKLYRSDENKSVSFLENQFVSLIGEPLRDKLVDAGVLIRESASASAVDMANQALHFQHHLQHDFLAAQYLARMPSLWGWDAFDAVSLESASYSCLAMCLEMVASLEDRDRFVRSLYNWSWLGTVMAMAGAARGGAVTFPAETQVPVLANVAEKLLDPVAERKEWIKRALRDFPDGTGLPFASVASLRELVEIVGMVQSSTAEFLQWKQLFMMAGEVPLNEYHINVIASPDSVLGWTAANVIKRHHLSAENLLQLRTLAVGTQPAVRWRVVHSVGRSYDPGTVAFLHEQATADSSSWVRFGAVRSLMEMGGTTEDAALRRLVLDGLRQGVEAGTIRGLAFEKIGLAACFDGVTQAWLAEISPLLHWIRDRQSGRIREDWDAMVKAFEQWTSKSRASDGSN